MLLYALCTAGEFVWNEGGVVPATCYLLPAPYITICDFLVSSVRIRKIHLLQIETWKSQPIKTTIPEKLNRAEQSGLQQADISENISSHLLRTALSASSPCVTDNQQKYQRAGKYQKVEGQTEEQQWQQSESFEIGKFDVQSTIKSKRNNNLHHHWTRKESKRIYQVRFSFANTVK